MGGGSAFLYGKHLLIELLLVLLSCIGEQQATLIYLLIYYINLLFFFCQLDTCRRSIHIDLPKK